MSKHAATSIQLGVLAGIIALVGVGLWQIHGDDPMLLSIELRRTDIMNTNCQLRAIVPANRRDTAQSALEDAVAALQRTERLLSAWRPGSDIRRLNDQEAGQVVMLDPQTVEILTMSRDLAQQTGGAFDVTCAPLFNVWRKAGELDKLPTNEAVDKALQACGWYDGDDNRYRLHPDSAMKLHAAAKVDLGGIAKGYGIDLAIEAMRTGGVDGGLVEVGGDIRCFGAKPGGGKWRILVKSPFKSADGDSIGVLRLREGAICTSGNYERFVEIEGKRYSHIIDPCSGRPVDAAPSVTVVATTAVQADAWATALSVLAARPEGPLAALDMLKDTDIEAMIVVGTEKDHQIHATDGFQTLLEKK